MAGFWDGFGDEDNFNQMVGDESPPTNSLAREVLDAYDIPCKSTAGGPLAYVDIKRMDAKTVLNLSLFETFAKNNNTPFIEPIVDEDGQVDFKSIGTYEGLNNTDIYHTLQSDNFKNVCTGVMITGGKPHVRRRNADDTPSADWQPIWGGTNGTESSKEIFTMADKMRTNCLIKNFNQHATIVYDDPNLKGSSYNDGIDNLYEINSENPWDEIIGYAVRREWPSGDVDGENISDYIKSRPAINIKQVAQSIIPIRVGYDGDDPEHPNLGESLVQPEASIDVTDEGCWTQEGQGSLPPSYPDNKPWGVKIDIPDRFRWEFNEKIGDEDETIKIDKFLRVSEVYALGILMEECAGHPQEAKDSLLESTPANTKVEAIIIDDYNKPFRLKEGYHYVIAYEENNSVYKDPYICFADNSRPNDNAKFGTGCVFNVLPDCPYANKNARTEDGDIDWKEITGLTGSILPLDRKSALWVKEIWAIIEIDTPSIKIYDPDGHALDIADNMEYLLKPMVLISKPPPIGYCSRSSLGGNGNGSLIDLTESKQDNDPTTMQDFTNTQFELALDEMSGGSGLSMTLSFLVAGDDDNVADSREDQGEAWVKNCSEKVWELMDEDTVQTTYICGPTCRPVLGGYVRSGGVVNSIEYSYSDSGSYTISVVEGPMQAGNFPEISNGMASKAVEDKTTTGVVIQDMGNQCHYKVRIDDMGERIAINTQHDILRIGDRVSCTVRNNPVEQ